MRSHMWSQRWGPTVLQNRLSSLCLLSPQPGGYGSSRIAMLLVIDVHNQSYYRSLHIALSAGSSWTRATSPRIIRAHTFRNGSSESHAAAFAAAFLYSLWLPLSRQGLLGNF